MADNQTTKRNLRFKDLTGRIFGRLTVVEVSHMQGTAVVWRCLCECSAYAFVRTGNLRNGNQISCGCWLKEHRPRFTITHGMRYTPEYEAWRGAKARCFNLNHKSFPEYGGRGIGMSENWKSSFDAFYADMGPRPHRTTLDRIDNNGPYTGPCFEYPNGNCRWATRLQQADNRRPRRWGRKPVIN